MRTRLQLRSVIRSGTRYVCLEGGIFHAAAPVMRMSVAPMSTGLNCLTPLQKGPSEIILRPQQSFGVHADMRSRLSNPPAKAKAKASSTSSWSHAPACGAPP
jgi:hypothetical protein